LCHCSFVLAKVEFASAFSHASWVHKSIIPGFEVSASNCAVSVTIFIKVKEFNKVEFAFIDWENSLGKADNVLSNGSLVGISGGSNSIIKEAIIVEVFKSFNSIFNSIFNVIPEILGNIFVDFNRVSQFGKFRDVEVCLGDEN